MPASWGSQRALQSRRRLPAKMGVPGSRPVPLVDGNNREHHRGCADARDGIDRTVKHRLGETAPCCRHWRRLCPAVALRIEDFIGMEDAANFVGPTFAADCVNLAIE